MTDQIEMDFTALDETEYDTLEPLRPLSEVTDHSEYKKTLIACLKVKNYSIEDVQKVYKTIESLDNKINKIVDFWNDKEEEVSE